MAGTVSNTPQGYKRATIIRCGTPRSTRHRCRGSTTRWRPVQETLAPFLAAGEPPSIDALDALGTFANLLRDAGLRDVDAADDPFDIELPDPAEWWEYLWWSGYRGMMERIPPADRDRARELACAAAETLREPDGRLVMRVYVRSATATGG